MIYLSKQDLQELTHYWHTARIAMELPDRLQRINYAVREFCKAHPEFKFMAVYKTFEPTVRGYGF